MVNEFNEYVRDCFSDAGEIVIKSMMGGYLVYFKASIQELLDGMYAELPKTEGDTTIHNFIASLLFIVLK